MDLFSLVPVLVAAYGVVLGAAALVTAWPWLTARTSRTNRRRAAVPPVGIDARDMGGGFR
jgi:hypothetical protein